MLVDDIKAQMFAAMKAKDAVKKEVLRTALGELTKHGDAADDATTEKTLRKLVKSNRETLEHATDATQRADLQREIEILEGFLPQALSPDGIVAALAPVADAIRAAGNDGQATGIAMKQLKGTGAVVEGKDVAVAVRQIRG